MKANNVIFTISIIVAMLVTLLAACAPTGEKYALSAQVVECDASTDTVVCEDYTGNLWEFDGVDDWEVGDYVALLMNDCGTSSIYDDEIISARYQG